MDERKSVFLTTHEAAEILKMSPSRIYSLCLARRIKYYRFGTWKDGTIRIDESDLESYRLRKEGHEGRADDWWKRGEEPPEFER